MEQEKFLKRETKVFAVVTSVLLGLALLILVVIGLIGGNFLSISVVGSSVVLFVSAIFMGSMQIRVFSNYKSQKKYLCADGIFYICLTSLVAITSMIFVFIPNTRFDVRYFIFVFAIAFAIASVPLEKFENSKTPIGPFQMKVFPLLIMLLYNLIVFGPMSSPIKLLGILSTS